MARILGLAVALVLLCLPSPAAAESDAGHAYNYLIESKHTPLPLVPTTLPPLFGSFATVPAMNTEKGSNYVLLFTRIPAGKRRADATLYVITAARRSLSSLKRSLRKLYKARKTKVRGRPALAFKRKGNTALFLAWVEDGILYEVATNTPKKVSNADLVATANGLEHLLGKVYGESLDPNRGLGIYATGYVTERHLLLDLNWDAPCFEPGQTQDSRRAQNGVTAMTSLNAAAFAVGPAVTAVTPAADEPASWTFAAAGTASAAGGQITAQAAGDVANSNINLHCTVGPLNASLQPVR